MRKGEPKKNEVKLLLYLQKLQEKKTEFELNKKPSMVPKPMKVKKF